MEAPHVKQWDPENSMRLHTWTSRGEKNVTETQERKKQVDHIEGREDTFLLPMQLA